MVVNMSFWCLARNIGFFFFYFNYNTKVGESDVILLRKYTGLFIYVMMVMMNNRRLMTIFSGLIVYHICQKTNSFKLASLHPKSTQCGVLLNVHEQKKNL